MAFHKMSKKQRLHKAAESRKITKAVFTGLGVMTFLARVTKKARTANQYQGSTGQKVKTLINNVGGNMFGINVIDDGVTPKFQQQRNYDISTYWNDESKLGFSMISYGILGGIMKKVPIAGKYIKLPMYRKVGRAGGVVVGASALGTFFDDVPQTNDPNAGQAWRPQYQQIPMTSINQSAIVGQKTTTSMI